MAPAQFIWLFFSLSGRISPAPYLLAGLLLLIIRAVCFRQLLLAVPDSVAQTEWALAFLVAGIMTAWSNIALTSKRFHDFGKPATWALIAIVVDLLTFLVLPFVKGDPGPNRYGPTTNWPG